MFFEYFLFVDVQFCMVPSLAVFSSVVFLLRCSFGCFCFGFVFLFVLGGGGIGHDLAQLLIFQWVVML